MSLHADAKNPTRLLWKSSSTLTIDQSLQQRLLLLLFKSPPNIVQPSQGELGTLDILGHLPPQTSNYKNGTPHPGYPMPVGCSDSKDIH